MEILDSHKIQNILKTPINQPSFCDCSASHREKKKIKKTDVSENASCLDFFILMINTEQILLVTVFTNTTFSTALDNKNKLHYKIPLKVSVKLKDKKAKHHFIKASRRPRRQPGFLLLVSIGVQIPGQDQLPDFHFSIGEAKKLPWCPSWVVDLLLLPNLIQEKTQEKKFGILDAEVQHSHFAPKFHSIFFSLPWGDVCYPPAAADSGRSVKNG